MQRIGILGGSFDPIHRGHLEMARYCLNDYGLDRILFLPVGDAPYKSDLTPAPLRYEMVLNAIKNEPSFFASDMEIKRSGKTYTYDTLVALHQQKKDACLYYIIGADKVNDLPLWHRAGDIFRMTEFIVIGRAGYEADYKAACRSGAKLHIANHCAIDISSTQIRCAVQKGEDISGLVSPGVKEIIEQHGLYRH